MGKASYSAWVTLRGQWWWHQTGCPWGHALESPSIHLMVAVSSTEVQCRLRPVCPPRGRHLSLHVSAGGEVAPSASEYGQACQGPWPAREGGRHPRPRLGVDGDRKPTWSRAGALAQTCLSLPVYPIQIHTFWVDSKNFVEVTRKWYAEALPFPLNFFLPGRMQRQHMERLQLLCGEHRPEDEEELEKEVRLGQAAIVRGAQG